MLHGETTGNLRPFRKLENRLFALANNERLGMNHSLHLDWKAANSITICDD